MGDNHYRRYLEHRARSHPAQPPTPIRVHTAAEILVTSATPAECAAKDPLR